MKALLISALIAGAAGTGSLCGICEEIAIARQSIVDVNRSDNYAEKIVRFKVEGMTCAGCVLGARKVIENVAGVRKAEIDYKTKTAVVWYDPAKVQPEAIIDALKTKLGYVATILDENS